MAVGPVQLLMVGFEDPQFKGEILEEFKRLKEADIVRVIDMIVVRKDDDGNVVKVHASDLDQEEAMEFGATVGALLGFGMAGEEGAEAGAVAGAEALEDGHAFDDDAWVAIDAIPNGTAAGVALIEHRWAIPLRDSIARAGGFVLADEWIHAKDLVAIGVMAAAEAEAQAAAEPQKA